MSAIVGVINGELVEQDKFVLPFYDLTILRGVGVFDYLVTYQQRPFRLKEHIERFFRSAKTLGVPIYFTPQEIENWVHELISAVKDQYGEMGIRIIGSAGIGRDTLSVGKNGLVFISVEERGILPVSLYEQGAKCLFVEYQRDYPTAKSTQYLKAVIQMEKARKVGAVEILYHNEGFALEGSTSNLFIFRRGVLSTPQSKVLRGITAEFIIQELCTDIKVEIRSISVGEVLSADEVFITASNKEILPVVQIDEKQIADGMVGQTSKELMKRFRQKVFSEI